MKKRLLSVLLVILMMFCIPAYAHSGRTDSSGGHRDNKNVSGLGYYHYHHGYGPHLHPGGVCPYASKTSSNSSYSPSIDTTQYATKAKTEIKTSVSDIKAYINYNFIPTINLQGKTYVVAEDLSYYGYDVTWNTNSRSLKIKRNNSNSFCITGNQNTSTSFTVQDSNIETYFYNGVTGDYVLVPSYNIGGKTIISLSNIGERVWDSTTRTIYVTI